MSRKPQEDLGVHGHPVGRSVVLVLVILAMIGGVSAVASIVGVTTQGANQTSSNNAAGANQHYQQCAATQGGRWRHATTQLQIGIADLAESNKDPAKVTDALDAISTARAELAAVDIDDARLYRGVGKPLCPYVAGQPERTPSRPVDPTPPATRPGG